MISDLSKAISQIGDPRFRSVMLKTAGVAFLVLILLWIGLWYGLSAIPLGWAEGSWFAEPLGWLVAVAWFGGFVLSWILFPVISSAVIGLFVEDIVDAVEERHYPDLPVARPQPLPEVVWLSVKFMLLALVLNLIFLPLYLILPALNLLIFYGLNGYLLGREYFELVAFRRHTPREAQTLRRRNRARTFLDGVVFTFLLTIPLVNLVAPILSAATMTHQYHRIRARDPGSVAPPAP